MKHIKPTLLLAVLLFLVSCASNQNVDINTDDKVYNNPEAYSGRK